MKTIRVAIVDDNSADMERAMSAIRNITDENQYTVTIKQFSNGKQLIADLEEQILYDVYLLDIELPDQQGYNLAQAIHMIDPSAYVVFHTSHDDLGKNTFPYFPFATIFKTEGEKPIRVVMDRIFRELQNSKDTIYVIQNERRFVRFAVREIVYLEKEKKHTIFHCTGDVTYWERKSLREVYRALPEDEFAYIDKGKVINLAHIRSIREHELTTTENVKLIISRQTEPVLREKLMDYYDRR